MTLAAAASRIQKWWRKFFRCPATFTVTHPSNSSCIFHANRLIRVNTEQTLLYLQKFSTNRCIFNTPLHNNSIKVILMDSTCRRKRSARLKRKHLDREVQDLELQIQKRRAGAHETAEIAGDEVFDDILTSVKTIASGRFYYEDSGLQPDQMQIAETEWVSSGSLLYLLRCMKTICDMYHDGEVVAVRLTQKMFYEALVNEQAIPSNYSLHLCNAIACMTSVFFGNYKSLEGMPENVSKLLPRGVPCYGFLCKLYDEFEFSK